jgi:hypothetical protein
MKGNHLLQADDKKSYEVSQEFASFLKQSFGVALDFSVESLRMVDEYLVRVHTALRKQSGLLGRLRPRKITEEGKWQIIGQAGFYTGEVVRLNLAPDHHWYRYADWIAAFPSHESYLGSEPGMGTIYILGNTKGDMCLPLGKVGKFLESGAQDSVFYFAKTFEAVDQ